MLSKSYVSGCAPAFPRSITDKYISTAGPWTLVNARGETWPGAMTLKKGGGAATLTGGWGPFVKANGLQEGDEVAFEVGSGAARVVLPISVFCSPLAPSQRSRTCPQECT